MNKTKKTTAKGVQAPAALERPSRVIREEQTYTTTKKSWPICWRASVHEKDGSRSVEVKKGIWIELFRSVEFFPSRFLAGLTPAQIKGWNREKDLKLEDLQAFLEEYIAKTRGVNVMHFDKRPRPQSQIELEEELTSVYEDSRNKDSVIAHQGEQLEELRKRLKELEAGKRA